MVVKSFLFLLFYFTLCSESEKVLLWLLMLRNLEWGFFLGRGLCGFFVCFFFLGDWELASCYFFHSENSSLCSVGQTAFLNTNIIYMQFAVWHYFRNGILTGIFLSLCWCVNTVLVGYTALRSWEELTAFRGGWCWSSWQKAVVHQRFRLIPFYDLLSL